MLENLFTIPVWTLVEVNATADTEIIDAVLQLPTPAGMVVPLITTEPDALAFAMAAKHNNCEYIPRSLATVEYAVFVLSDLEMEGIKYVAVNPPATLAAGQSIPTHNIRDVIESLREEIRRFANRN